MKIDKGFIQFTFSLLTPLTAIIYYCCVNVLYDQNWYRKVLQIFIHPDQYFEVQFLSRLWFEISFLKAVIYLIFYFFISFFFVNNFFLLLCCCPLFVFEEAGFGIICFSNILIKWSFCSRHSECTDKWFHIKGETCFTYMVATVQFFSETDTCIFVLLLL